LIFFWIILLVWIAPALLLFIHLAWKAQLLPRYVDSLKTRIADLNPTDPLEEISLQSRWISWGRPHGAQYYLKTCPIVLNPCRLLASGLPHANDRA
jgi:hypothetical protein